MSSPAAVPGLLYATCAVCGLAAVENLLALVVFAATKSLRTKHYALVVNLAAADLVYAVFAILSIVFRFEIKALAGISSAAATASLLTVLAVAVNRYLSLAVQPPGRYDALVTGRRLVGVCLVCWCVGLAYGLAVNLTDSTFHVVDTVVYPFTVALLWAVMAGVYVLAFRTVKRYTPLDATLQGVSVIEEQDRTRLKETRRVLVLFSIILLVSFLTWVPALSLRPASFFKPALWGNPAYLTSVYAAYLAYTLSTVINPLLYVSRLDGFKEGFCAIFCRCCIKVESPANKADPITYDNPGTETGI